MNKLRQRFTDSGPALIVLVLITTIWEVYGRATPAYVFPTLGETWAGLQKLMTSGEFFQAAGASLQSMILGFLLAVAVGVFIGALMGWFHSVGEFTDVYVSIGLAIPMSAAVPVVVAGLGIGLASRTAVVFLFAVFIIIVNTYAGIRQTSTHLLEMGRSFGASRIQEFWKIIWPSALPAIAAGLRLGAGRSVVGMVVSELLLVSVGLGRLISEFKADMEIGSLMALLTVMLVGGALLVYGIEVLERCLFPWRKKVL